MVKGVGGRSKEGTSNSSGKSASNVHSYLVPFRPIWGIDELRVGEKKRFNSNKILKYIEF
jgi:hypothetical protein